MPRMLRFAITKNSPPLWRRFITRIIESSQNKKEENYIESISGTESRWRIEISRAQVCRKLCVKWRKVYLYRRQFWVTTVTPILQTAKENVRPEMISEPRKSLLALALSTTLNPNFWVIEHISVTHYAFTFALLDWKTELFRGLSPRCRPVNWNDSLGFALRAATGSN